MVLLRLDAEWRQWIRDEGIPTGSDSGYGRTDWVSGLADALAEEALDEERFDTIDVPLNLPEVLRIFSAELGQDVDVESLYDIA